MPYIQPDERKAYTADKISHQDLKKLSVARCARVSYLSQEGHRDHLADLVLFDRLVDGMHWSPFEHVAEAIGNAALSSGNFHGWQQYRKTFIMEYR